MSVASCDEDETKCGAICVELESDAATAPGIWYLTHLTTPSMRVAGVQEVIVCTPRGLSGEISPLVLAAAEVAGVDRLFGIGGVQAIAAMAYGTETIRAVDRRPAPPENDRRGPLT